MKWVIANASMYPTRAFDWYKEIDRAISIEDLEDSGEFETLDMKIADAFARAISGEFARQISILETELMEKHGKFLKGRQIAWLLNNFFRMSEVEGSILEFEDILNVELRNGNLKQFLYEWDLCIMGMKEPPSESQK